MYRLAVLILLPALLIAQPSAFKPSSPPVTLKATLLDGSTQYWSKSSPVNMDLNGSELITASDDRTFESTVGNWTKAGTVSAAVRSTVDKRTGTASMRITSSGAGDTTSNYTVLNYPNFTTLVSGNKYTLELYARSATASRTITVRIGDASVTSATLSTTFGTFTKVVLNFQATATTVNHALYVTTSGAIDSLYVDDVSLTQAYDLMIVAALKKNTNSSEDGVVGFKVNNTAGFPGWATETDATGKLKGYVADGTNTASFAGGTALRVSSWELCAITFDMTGNGQTYLNGVADGAGVVISSVGKKTSGATSLLVGAFCTSFLALNDGSIGPVVIVRYNALPSDIANIIANISATWRKKGLPKTFDGGTVVAYYDWLAGGLDKSGTGNTLTPTAGPGIIKFK